jgi:hypothetical protein
VTDFASLAAMDQIAACIHEMFIGTDQRQWRQVRARFTDLVHFDMTSLAGGTPQELTPQQITDGWEEGLKGLEQIHHQTGNFLISVNGDTAKAFCYGIALHYRTTQSGANVRRFVGSYEFVMQRTAGRWLIASLEFTLQFVDGNRELEKSP